MPGDYSFHTGNMSAFMRRQMGAAPVMSTMSSGGYGTGYGTSYGAGYGTSMMTSPQYMQQAPVQTMAAPQYMQQASVQTMAAPQYMQQARVQTMAAPQMMVQQAPVQTMAAPQYIQQAPGQRFAAPQMMVQQAPIQTMAAPQYMQQAQTFAPTSMMRGASFGRSNMIRVASFGTNMIRGASFGTATARAWYLRKETMRLAKFQDEFRVMRLPLRLFFVQPKRVLRVSIFVFDVASCPDSYSSVNSFSCLIYLYVCAPLVVQLHLLSLVGSSHDNHSGHL